MAPGGTGLEGAALLILDIGILKHPYGKVSIMGVAMSVSHESPKVGPGISNIIKEYWAYGYSDPRLFFSAYS